MSKIAKKVSKKAPKKARKPKALRLSKPGMYADIPIRDYVRDPCPTPSLSTSVIETMFERSPAHVEAEHVRLGGADDVDEQKKKDAEIGSAVHALALLDGNPEDHVTYIDANSYYGKDAKKARAAAHAEGKVPILISDMEDVERAAAAARAFIADVFGDVVTEQTYVWKEGGIWHRSRPDFRAGARVLGDLKTTKDAQPYDWINRTFYSSAYDIQATHQLAGHEQLAGEKRDFIFVVQEVKKPYANCLVGLGEEDHENAKLKRDRAVRWFAKCLREKSWPGYGRDIHWTAPKPWRQAMIAERFFNLPELA